MLYTVVAITTKQLLSTRFSPSKVVNVMSIALISNFNCKQDLTSGARVSIDRQYYACGFKSAPCSIVLAIGVDTLLQTHTSRPHPLSTPHTLLLVAACK